jgi:hypothetical protein
LDSFVSSAALPIFDISSEAVVHEEDAAPLPLASGAGVPAAPERSFFQTDVLGIRQLWFLNWALRRPGSTAWMQNVTW